MEPRDLKMISPADFDALKAELCRRDFGEFVREFWGEICSDPLVWNWHMDVLCSELQLVYERVIARQTKQYDLVINVPPGSSKSTICSQMAQAWSWTRDAQLRHMTGSYSQALSYEQAQYTRDIIKCDKYRRYYPGMRLKEGRDSISNYRTMAGGQRFSCSVGGSATGFHAHIITIDDPINPKQSASEVELKSANEWIDKTLTTRKVDKSVSAMVLIMQRLHENDPTGHLIGKAGEGKAVRHICIPGEECDTINPPELRKHYRDGLMDPIRIPRHVLEELRIELGSYAYAGQILQNPAPEEGGLIKAHWFQRIGWQEFFEMAANQAPVWQFVSDGAYTADERNDPCGLMAYCCFNNSLFIRKSRTRHLEQPEYERWIEEFFREEHGSDRLSKVRIEPKANGISTAQHMQRRSKLNILLGPAPTRDKVSRVKDKQPFLESGRCYLICTGGEEWVSEFLGEIKVFPNGRHDEHVDMLVMACDDVQAAEVTRPGVALPVVKVRPCIN